MNQAELTLLIPGVEIKEQIGTRIDLGEFDSVTAEVVGAFELEQSRAASSEFIQHRLADDEIVEVKLEDGITLYLSGDSYLDLTKKTPQLDRSETIRASINLELDDPSRGFKSFFIKSLRFLKLLSPADELADRTATEIAKKIEDRLEYGPGLYRCRQEQFGLEKITGAIPARQAILLFIHGTASSTEGSFGDLWHGEQNALWRNYAKNAYGEQIYAFEHRTLSESPIDNVIQLAEALPQGAILHLVSHSRGGLVGELLCRGQIASGHQPFNDDMLGLFEPEPGAAEERKQAIKKQRESLVLLNGLLKRKKIKVERFVRVACPARGTTLASRRLDLYFSIFLNAIGLIPALRLSPSYRFVKAFLLAVAKERTQPEDLPGLEAMMPTSRLIRMINWPWPPSAADLSVIAGDIEAGGLFHGLAVLATDLFYLEEHDLVVNTGAMVGDAPRESGIRRSFHQGPEVNHFSYFNNLETVQKLIGGLARADNSDGGYEPVSVAYRAGTRGDSEIHLDKDAPIVYMLPGLCGSHLHNGEEHIWIDLINLATGRFSELNIQQAGIQANDLHDDTYGDLLDYLRENHHVTPFPTDWRCSSFQSAKILADDIRQRLHDTRNNPVPIRLLAHSQGGLVARAMIAQAPDVWADMLKREGSRLVMLGTPNQGSYSVVRLLLGHERLARLLALLDFRHDLRSILKVLIRFPGMLEMLPAAAAGSNFDLFDIDSWKRLQQTSPDEYVLPDEGDLINAQKNRQRLDNQLQAGGGLICAENICYIAGRDNATPAGISLEECKDGLEVKFTYTARGDGRVTWESGHLPKVNTWYAEAKHGDLSSQTELFPALLDLLETGQTFRLSDRPLTARSGVARASRGVDEIILYPDAGDLAEAASLSSGKSSATKDVQTQLRVKITHDDLRHAKYPVAVGHYQDDLIVTAEEALNQKVNGRLGISYQLGLYPGKIKTANSFLKPATPGKEALSGAIVIGLGYRGTLSAALLQTSVTYALLDFVRTVHEQQLTDHKSLGVTFLLLGTGIGGLTMADSLSAILRGITQANSALKNKFFDSLHIREIEFIEIYLDRAVRAMRALRRICSSEEFKPGVRLEQFIESGKDGRERIPHHRNKSVWQRLQITSEKNGALRYTYLTERARADAILVQTQRRLIDNFIEQAIATRQSDKGLAGCLFELLAPNDFKNNAPHQDDTLLILDEDTARYPWEMLQQKLDRETLPMAVRAGMIRQLIMDKHYSRPHGVFRGPNNALVIGDPITAMGKFPALQGARQEAFSVTEKLVREGGFNVETRIESHASDIIKALYAKPYRILHLAGHGVYHYDHPETEATEQITGMVLSHGIFLTPAEVKQMSTIPELVFINCCYLGYIENRQTRGFATYLKPHLMAANLATQFIREGVRCVIAAGWEVHDPAANVFAQVFYEQMLAPNNATFGDAVQSARKKVYKRFPGINTWGAYQCYGDPHFRLIPGASIKSAEESVIAWRQQNTPAFTAPKELMLTLWDLAKEASSGTDIEKKKFESKLQRLITQTPKKWYRDGALYSAIAAVWSALGKQDKAVICYDKAMQAETAKLSFETIDQIGEAQIKNVSRQLAANEITDEKPVAILKATSKQVIHLNAIASSKNREGLVGRLNESVSHTYRHLGDYYKQQAIESSEDNRLHAINNMIRYYKKALEHSKDTQQEVNVHALLQWQIATVVKNWRSRKNELEDTEKWLQVAKESLTEKAAPPGHLQPLIDKADYKLVTAVASDSIGKNRNIFEGNIDMIAECYADALKLEETGKTKGILQSGNVMEAIDFLLVLSRNRRTKTAQIAQKNLLLLQRKLNI